MIDKSTAVFNLRKDTGRRVFWDRDTDKVFLFRSWHPLEERLIELTNDYRDANGEYIIPEAVAWDGVQTCPGLFLADPDEEA